MKFITIIGLSIFSVFYSCNIKEEKPASDLIEIDLSNPTIRPILLSDIADSIQYIPLETKKEAYISFISSIFHQKQKFIIKQGGEVLIFDDDGTFRKKLFNEGRGPTESFARTITLDEINDIIYLYDNFSHNIKKYNSIGDYLGYLKDPYDQYYLSTNDLGFFNGSLLFTFQVNPIKKTFFSSWNIASLKEVYSYENKYDFNFSKPIRMSDYNMVQSQNLGELLYFKEQFNDTIFSTKDFKSIKPSYVINLGSSKLSYLEYMGMCCLITPPPENKSRIGGFLISNNFILFIYEYNLTNYLGYYNFITGLYVRSEKFEIINDIDYGPNINVFNMKMRIQGSRLFVPVEAINFLDNLENPKFHCNNLSKDFN